MTDMLKELPTMLYNGYVARNILARSVIIESVLNRYRVNFPYSVKDGERPDIIASDYYGASEYAWLVMYCNIIIDPYFEWVLPHREFLDMLKDKYGNITTIKNTPAFYEYSGINGEDTTESVMRKDWRMSPTTFRCMGAVEKSGWVPVTIFQDEERKNNSRRNIKLISNSYVQQIDAELKDLYN